MRFTVFDLLAWLTDVSTSASQIQKAYDWQISQWANFGNATLTAIFGLLASAIVETYKDTLHLPHFWRIISVSIAVYFAIYVFCRLKISWLRRDFVTLYTLLLELK